MNRPHRHLRPITWAALLLLLALTGAWALSGSREVAFMRLGPDCVFRIERGEASLLYWKRDPSEVFRCRLRGDIDIAAILDQIAHETCWTHHWNWSVPSASLHRTPVSTTAEAILPLWTIILPAAFLSLFLIHGDRCAARRALGNLCPHCSYPRRGLPPPSLCPECGHAPAPRTGSSS